MKLTNYHTHMYLCRHATGTSEDYILKAIEEGYSEIGISDHGPYHDYLKRKLNSRRMTMNEFFNDYIPDLNRLKEQYKDQSRYQTVYNKVSGSSAAPTAGLHFTTELLDKLKAKGVTIVEVLLHVGLGTFRPVSDDNILNHKMHSEYIEMSAENAEFLNNAKKEGRRIIACGTTSIRVLESSSDEKGIIQPCKKETDIFIYPGYTFKVVDGVITNFHLPESTLIMLVSAFLGYDKTMEMYELAVNEKYRFFSFGDATLLI